MNSRVHGPATSQPSMLAERGGVAPGTCWELACDFLVRSPPVQRQGDREARPFSPSGGERTDVARRATRRNRCLRPLAPGASSPPDARPGSPSQREDLPDTVPVSLAHQAAAWLSFLCRRYRDSWRRAAVRATPPRRGSPVAPDCGSTAPSTRAPASAPSRDPCARKLATICRRYSGA